MEAKRDGQPVTVRVRHSSREFLQDYMVDYCYGCYVGSKWVKEDGIWVVRNKDGSRGSGVKYEKLEDPNDKYYATSVPSPLVWNNAGGLYRKSMKGIVDVWVCWVVTSILEPGMEVLELSKLFETKVKQTEYYALKHRYKKGYENLKT